MAEGRHTPDLTAFRGNPSRSTASFHNLPAAFGRKGLCFWRFSFTMYEYV